MPIEKEVIFVNHSSSRSFHMHSPLLSNFVLRAYFLFPTSNFLSRIPLQSSKLVKTCKMIQID